MGLGSGDRLRQGQNHTKLTFTSEAALLAIFMCLKGEPKALFDFCFRNILCILSWSSRTCYYFEHICECQCHVRSVSQVTSQCAQKTFQTLLT